MKVIVMDIQGKVVANFNKAATIGTNSITINGSSLNGSGIYFVKVVVGGESRVMKLVKQ
jgi:hypothetical protein